MRPHRCYTQRQTDSVIKCHKSTHDTRRIVDGFAFVDDGCLEGENTGPRPGCGCGCDLRGVDGNIGIAPISARFLRSLGIVGLV